MKKLILVLFVVLLFVSVVYKIKPAAFAHPLDSAAIISLNGIVNTIGDEVTVLIELSKNHESRINQLQSKINLLERQVAAIRSGKKRRESN